ncbi:hypothetical protein ACG9XP_17655 [Acinetobacter baumannii]|uniref:hypothetical protein n=1 Tax=Acinetobacter baumannii TaxID=470 RepID=UPI003AF650A3
MHYHYEQRHITVAHRLDDLEINGKLRSVFVFVSHRLDDLENRLNNMDNPANVRHRSDDLENYSLYRSLH